VTEEWIRERRHTHVDKDGNTKIASVESEAQTYTKAERHRQRVCEIESEKIVSNRELAREIK
jgi:hypothetical protein